MRSAVLSIVTVIVGCKADFSSLLVLILCDMARMLVIYIPRVALVMLVCVVPLVFVQAVFAIAVIACVVLYIAWFRVDIIVGISNPGSLLVVAIAHRVLVSVHLHGAGAAFILRVSTVNTLTTVLVILTVVLFTTVLVQLVVDIVLRVRTVRVQQSGVRTVFLQDGRGHDQFLLLVRKAVAVNGRMLLGYGRFGGRLGLQNASTSTCRLAQSKILNDIMHQRPAHNTANYIINNLQQMLPVVSEVL